jgi:hypothetical protein
MVRFRPALQVGVLTATLALAGGGSEAVAKPPQSGAPPKQVEFDGRTLELAWESENPDLPVVEFIPKGETLEKWTHLASIRQFPDVGNPQELAKLTLEQVAKDYPGAPTNMAVDPNETEAIIEFVADAPDDSFAEYNIFKYAKNPDGGVVAQQYALRGYGDRQKFLEELSERRQKLLDEMAEKGLSSPKQRPK